MGKNVGNVHLDRRIQYSQRPEMSISASCLFLIGRGPELLYFRAEDAGVARSLRRLEESE